MKRAVDALAYSVGLLGNLAVIPQVVSAWQGAAPGLAIATWLLYFLIGLVWLAYAVAHRQRPLMLAQAACLLGDAAVVVGWLLHTWRP